MPKKSAIRLETTVQKARGLYREGERQRQRVNLCRELLSVWLRRITSADEAIIEQTLREILPILQEIIQYEAPQNKRFELCDYGPHYPNWPSRTQPPKAEGTPVGEQLFDLLDAEGFDPQIKWKWTSDLPQGGGRYYLTAAVYPD